VRYLAEQVGIKEIDAQKSPEEKLAIVRKETAEAKTLYVGDGINDAPAMMAATVGIAIGQNSDAVQEPHHLDSHRAGVISGVLGEVVDAIAILAIVVLNAAIGFYQEFNAEKSIAALKKMTAPQAKVRRDGQVTSIPASGIVTGDILALEAGDLVAADARLLKAASLKCIESALTGESEAVTKQPPLWTRATSRSATARTWCSWARASRRGTGQAVVVATAMNTELGRIAGTDRRRRGGGTHAAGEETRGSFGRILVWAALGIVALLFGWGCCAGRKPLELFMTSVSLAVAAVPEGCRPSSPWRSRSACCACPAAARWCANCRRRDARLDDGHLHGQDRHVDRRRNDRARALRRRPKLRSHRRRLRAGGRSALRGQKGGRAHAAPLARTRDVLLGCNNAHLVEEDGTVESRRRSHRRRIAGGRPQSRRRPRAHRARNCRSITRIPFDSDRKRSTVIRNAGREAPRLHQRRARRAAGTLHQIYTERRRPPLTDEDRQRTSWRKHRDGAAGPARARLGLARLDNAARRTHGGRRGARPRVRRSVRHV
jgi:Ca2+-transporting ATPase